MESDGTATSAVLAYLGHDSVSGMDPFGWVRGRVGSHSHRELARARARLRRVDEVGEQLRGETDDTLRERANRLRDSAVRGTPLDDLLVPTYALVREVSHRHIGLRHFDVQMLGGAALARGNVVEMKTGEGKTLVATLPVVLNALSGRGAHVITVNDYLAERDARLMGPIYQFFGLSVGVVGEHMEDGADGPSRRNAYRADVTYVTNQELVFDYLRDNLAGDQRSQVHRPFHFALVDEVDLLLLDEASTPLIISGEADKVPELAQAAREIVASLCEGQHFKVDYNTRQVSIGDEGWTLMERAVSVGNLAAPENAAWQHALHNALLAHGVYKRDVDYIVRRGQVLLVDDHTGRVSADKRYSDGLHQALEAKEGVAIQAEDRTLAKISYQMFFRLYPRLCGMTGTAESAKDELKRAYGLRVVVIPPNRPLRRVDAPAVVFRTAAEKFDAVLEEIRALVGNDRPVLIGSTSVDESEKLARLLKSERIAHKVLNAKDDTAEAAIIAQAGQPGAVTISTNMAGRGVDIVLGGEPGADGAKESAAAVWEQRRARVMAQGGLMVIGTGLHESRRIDDQLRGRAGRQGDPGGSRYFLSLDDPIYRNFGAGDRGVQVIDSLRERLRAHPVGEPITDRVVLRTLRDLQIKVEVENEAIRRDVLRYDDVVDRQRQTIYRWRQSILVQGSEATLELLLDMADDLANQLVEPPAPLVAEESVDEPDNAALGYLRDLLAVSDEGSDEVEGSDCDKLEADVGRVSELLRQRLLQLQDKVGGARLADVAGHFMLAAIDERWTEHLNDLERVDEAVGLSGYAELDPFVEFAREARRLYKAMLGHIRASAIAAVLSMATAEDGDGAAITPALVRVRTVCRTRR